jgi:hypothetical protein
MEFYGMGNFKTCKFKQRAYWVIFISRLDLIPAIVAGRDFIAIIFSR